MPENTDKEQQGASKVSLNNELECNSCGAILKFKPGTHSLSCDYCGAENEIFDTNQKVVIEETSLESYFKEGLKQEETLETVTIRCHSCGAETTLEPNISSSHCPFCDTSLVVKDGSTAKIYKPKYLLPFDVDKKVALTNYKRWLKSLWFAPNDLKHYGDNSDHFSGVYIPFWTYDCHTDTGYSGERGEDYTERRRYNVVENGRNVTRTQNVVKTRWYRAAGQIKNFFDDVLVIASKSLPKDKMNQIQAWDVEKLVPYDDKYLSGFRTETYQVKIEEGYEEAKQKMNREIMFDIQQDIGGDRQRIHQAKTQYTGATFKQILVPVWLSAYRYKGKVYQFIINGRTGAVAGGRPYSVIKIVMAVLLAIVVLVLLSMFAG